MRNLVRTLWRIRFGGVKSKIGGLVQDGSILTESLKVTRPQACC